MSWPLTTLACRLFNLDCFVIRPQHSSIRLHHLSIFWGQQLGHLTSFVSWPLSALTCSLFSHESSIVWPQGCFGLFWSQPIEFSVLITRSFSLICVLFVRPHLRFNHSASSVSWPLLASTYWLFNLDSSTVRPHLHLGLSASKASWHLSASTYRLFSLDSLVVRPKLCLGHFWRKPIDFNWQLNRLT